MATEVDTLPMPPEGTNQKLETKLDAGLHLQGSPNVAVSRAPELRGRRHPSHAEWGAGSGQEAGFLLSIPGGYRGFVCKVGDPPGQTRRECAKERGDDYLDDWFESLCPC